MNVIFRIPLTNTNLEGLNIADKTLSSHTIEGVNYFSKEEDFEFAFFELSIKLKT